MSCLPDFFVVLDYLCWCKHIWVSILFFQILYSFTLAEIVLHQSAQLELLIVSTCNILGQMQLAVRVCFGVRPLPELQGWRCVLLAVHCGIGLLAYFPAHRRLEGGLHGCLSSPVRLPRWWGLGTLLNKRWSYELILKNSSSGNQILPLLRVCFFYLF